MPASGPCRSSGKSVRVTAAAAIFKDADFAIGAGDPVSAALELDVDFASLEHEAGDLAALVDYVVGGLSDNRGGQLHRPARMGAAPRGNPGGVVGDLGDALEWHAKPFGDELR